MVARGWGEGEWGVITSGVSFWDDENVLEPGRGDGCTTLNEHNTTELYTSKWLK